MDQSRFRLILANLAHTNSEHFHRRTRYYQQEAKMDLTVVRNLIIYVIGLAMSIAGALGLVEAIDFQPLVAALLFVVGLGLIIAVHEWLDGPF